MTLQEEKIQDDRIRGTPKIGRRRHRLHRRPASVRVRCPAWCCPFLTCDYPNTAVRSRAPLAGRLLERPTLAPVGHRATYGIARRRERTAAASGEMALARLGVGRLKKWRARHSLVNKSAPC
jgi:hypothetical protein